MHKCWLKIQTYSKVLKPEFWMSDRLPTFPGPDYFLFPAIWSLQMIHPALGLVSQHLGCRWHLRIEVTPGQEDPGFQLP